MSEIKHKDEERLSPRQAAERLTDIAYALTAGGTLNLGGGQTVTVPVVDEVVLKREGEVERRPHQARAELVDDNRTTTRVS